MDVVRIHEQLRELGLERLAEPILVGARPSIRLTTGAPSTGPENRLGGQPNLPPEIPWPRWNGDQALSFIAQFDLSTLPAVSGLPLPQHGSLFFFYDAQGPFSDFDPCSQGGTRVFYHDAPLTANPARDWPRGLEPDFCYHGVALTTALELSMPAIEDFQRQYVVTNQEAEAYLTFAPLDYGEHRMGGNAVPINGGDPRLQAVAVSHGLAVTTEGYDEARRRGLFSAAGEWLLLLQIDSGDYSAGMDFAGQGGRIYYMVHQDDLRRLCFDNVRLVLQYMI